jgi:simple sugar transport system ATP-binding protein
VDRGESHPAEPRLVITDLRVADDRGHEAVKGVSLDVRAGEILGIAGVAGNGQDELVEALTGLRQPTSGTVELAGDDVTGAGPRDLQRAGVSFVPGDRHRFGLVLSFPLEDNLVLTQYDEPPYATGFRGIIRNESAIHTRAKEAIGEFDIRTPSATVNAGTLSGGNQQKAVVAREFSRKLTALVLDQPTRGLDVGSIEFIHKQVIAKRDEGAAILLVSAELDEVMELSDRVAVMYRGEIVALVDGPTAEREEVGLLMATGRRDQTALAEATTSMAADQQLAEGAATRRRLRARPSRTRQPRIRRQPRLHDQRTRRRRPTPRRRATPMRGRPRHDPAPQVLRALDHPDRRDPARPAVRGDPDHPDEPGLARLPRLPAADQGV